MPVLRKSTKSLTVRLPVFLFEQVKREAEISRRSVNQQIIYMLEQFYPTKEDKDYTGRYLGPLMTMDNRNDSIEGE